VNYYPQVVSEEKTLARVVHQGASLSRFGDGEFKLCRGGGIKSQKAVDSLSKRLNEILKDSGECLVGIPNIRSDTPKAAHWAKYVGCCDWLVNREYCSAFVTRPDSAPWIDTPEYWEMIESLWVGRDITIVRGKTKSLVADDLVGAKRVTEIVAPLKDAWGDYESLLDRIGHPDRVLICLGPTATVMAVDLCAKGIQGIDLGHIGMFLRKHRRGEPMWVSDTDRAA
jgi:hypothetical protein